MDELAPGLEPPLEAIQMQNLSGGQAFVQPFGSATRQGEEGIMKW